MFIIKSKLKLRYKHNCLYIAESIINDKLLLGGAHLLPDLLLHLEAVLFVLLIALLHRLVAADVLLDGVAHGAQLLALAVLAHLPRHGLALLVVDVLLGLLGAGAGLQLALLHGLGVAVLLLHGEGELVGELLAVLAGLGLADLLLDFPGGVVALLGGRPFALDSSLAVEGLLLLAVEIHGEDTGAILHSLILVPTVLVVDIHALKVILGGLGQIVDGVAHPVSHPGAPLHGVGLVHHLVLDALGQGAHQLGHVEALPLLELVDDGGAVLLVHVLALLLLLGEAGLLHVGQALVLVDNLLHGVTVILIPRFVDLIRSRVIRVNRLVLLVASALT